MGLGANVFGQAVTIAIQLLSLPIFLHFWNISLYGEWLMLSAIPAYMSAMDVGILSVGMNRMTILAAGGDVRSAERVFHSLLAFALLAIGVVGTVVLAGLWLFSFGDTGSEIEHRLTLSMLLITSLMCVFCGLFEAVFRASDAYAKGIIALNLGRLSEWIGSIVGLVLGRSLFHVGLGLLCGRMLANVMTWIYVTRRYPQYRWHTREASRSELTAMILPGLSYLSLPAANALSLQGMVLLVGTMFGTPTLAVFSAYRTLSRVGFQAVNMLGRVLWPEFSRRYGERAYGTMQTLYRYGTFATLMASLGVASILYFAAPVILSIWTHGKISYLPVLFNILLLITAFSGIWQVGLILLTAVNQLGTVSIIYVSVSALSLAAAYIAGRWSGIEGASLAMLTTEIVMALTCFIYVRQFLGQYANECGSVLATR